MRVNPNLEARGDFPTLEGGYTNAMNLFTEIKNLKDEQEDIAKNLNKVNLLKDEIDNGDEEDMTPSVIKDMVD